MRKQFFFIFAILVASQLVNQLSAQQPFRKTTLYGELGGTGLILSVNYERQLANKPGFGLFAGIGLGGDKPALSCGGKYLVGLGNQKSFFETGAGVAFAERDAWDSKDFTTVEPNPYIPTFIPAVGYRHHTPYGLMWRVNYTPAFNRYRNVLWLFGISVGWRI